jgi:putative flippase GtrA
MPVPRALLLPSHNPLAQFVRYLFVGGISFAVDATMLALATQFLGLHYLAGNALGFLTGVTVNYLLSIRWVFAVRPVEDRSREMMVFFTIGAAGFLLSALLMALFVGTFHESLAVAKAATAILVLTWNFGLRKLLLFTDFQNLFRPTQCEEKA